MVETQPAPSDDAEITTPTFAPTTRVQSLSRSTSSSALLLLLHNIECVTIYSYKNVIASSAACHHVSQSWPSLLHHALPQRLPLLRRPPLLQVLHHPLLLLPLPNRKSSIRNSTSYRLLTAFSSVHVREEGSGREQGQEDISKSSSSSRRSSDSSGSASSTGSGSSDSRKGSAVEKRSSASEKHNSDESSGSSSGSISVSVN